MSFASRSSGGELVRIAMNAITWFPTWVTSKLFDGCVPKVLEVDD